MVATDQELVTRYIELHPRKRGTGEARLADSKIPIWALIGYCRMVDGDLDQVAADYDITREAVDAALAYYRMHKAAIDARLAANGG